MTFAGSSRITSSPFCQRASLPLARVERGGWAAGEQEREQLGCAIAPAQAHESPDIAQLVGRVIVPGRATVSPVVKFAPVTLVGRMHERGGQILGFSSRREGDACRSRVEV